MGGCKIGHFLMDLLMYETVFQKIFLSYNKLQYQESLLQYMDENNILMVQMHKICFTSFYGV